MPRIALPSLLGAVSASQGHSWRRLNAVQDAPAIRGDTVRVTHLVMLAAEFDRLSSGERYTAAEFTRWIQREATAGPFMPSGTAAKDRVSRQ